VRRPWSRCGGYVGTCGKLCVIGGSPYLLNMFTELMLGASKDQIPQLTARTLLASTRVTPFVAKVDTRTMRVDYRALASMRAACGFIQHWIT
jgi:hypothetical protein